MRALILDATIAKTEERFRGLAAKYLHWELARNGAKIVDKAEDADVVCATIVSPHEWECLPRALKRIGVPPERKSRSRDRHVFLGGQGASSPKIFDPYIDCACVGEGRGMLKVLARRGPRDAMAMMNAWVPGETREVVPDMEFPWDAPAFRAEDGIYRVYASRGCKKKCLFCHTGWSVVYQESDPQNLVDEFKKLRRRGLRVNVVTNDAPALDFFGDLDGLEHFSASYSQTKKMLESGVDALIGKVKSVRFGVESPSSRLRRLIGKPIDTNDLFQATCMLLNAGIGVRWFMIAGLPGETDEDYGELREVVMRARHEIKKGALQLSFTAFCPDCAAPLSLHPLDDSYYDRWHRMLWNWFFDGPGFTRRIQIFKCQGPESRMKHAIGSMGASEADIRRGWLDRDPPNWRVRYPYRDRARQAYALYAQRSGLETAEAAAAAVRDGVLARCV